MVDIDKWDRTWRRELFYTDRKEIDPRIFPLVKALNEKGYPTISSCEGHQSEFTWSVANVVFYSDKNKIIKLKEVLSDLIRSGKINDLRESSAIQDLYSITIESRTREETDNIITEVVERISKM